MFDGLGMVDGCCCQEHRNRTGIPVDGEDKEILKVFSESMNKELPASAVNFPLTTSSPWLQSPNSSVSVPLPETGHADDEPDAQMEERPETKIEGIGLYTGQWRGKFRHGKGRQVNEDGSVYEGEFFCSKAHGIGRSVKPNGNVYEGQWLQDQANGLGRYVHRSCGSTYEGEWINGESCGRGILTWKDGSSYLGQFSNSSMQGRGMLKSKKGQVIFEGEFSQGRRHGTGTNFYADGRKYVGPWHENHMHGKGCLEYADGSVYNGNFVNGVKEGDGCFKWPDGRSYDGQWRKGKRHGSGVYTDEHEFSLQGNWREGALVEEKVDGDADFSEEKLVDAEDPSTVVVAEKEPEASLTEANLLTSPSLGELIKRRADERKTAAVRTGGDASLMRSYSLPHIT